MSKIYESKTAASTYDSSRELPVETRTLWADVISELVPVNSAHRILDLGGGTGRFSFLLNQLYGFTVFTTDPSMEMLKQGLSNNHPYVEWVVSKAEYLPFESGYFDLVFMSQVYHHIEDMEHAFTEIHRVLANRGNLLIRNATIESSREVGWQTCFPTMINVEPYRGDIENTVSCYGFNLVTMQMVNQIFASSYEEYFTKVSQRGMSPLITLNDEDFAAGIVRFREWVDSKPKNTPVLDPVDIFHFRKV